ncbi:MAG: flagellar export protein FliJ [Deltaproteobacteria bacterium]|nr:MAG: flagellar export protein FliJ [Deltaproteobacteria bacterium]
MNKANLDLIVEFRSLREKRLSKELAMIRNRLKAKEEELNSIKNKKKWSLLRLREAQKDALDIYRIELISQHISGLDGKIKDIEKEIRQINQEYEKKLDQLLEARKQKKLVEKLRKRWIERQKYEFFRKEQNFLDEIATNNFIYKNA